MANEVKIKLAVDGAASVNTELSGVEGRLDRLTGAVKNSAHYGAGLAAAFGLVIPAISGTVRASIAAADAVTTLQNSLKLATGSAEKAGQAYEALFAIAQQSRVSFTELGGTFASISRAGQELGISQTRLLTVTQAIGQAMTISGGSAQGMQAALTQLGQGLASGTLRGEELNSVMEQAPRLAQALADGMGVPIGRLREMGAAGEITAEQVISALEKSAPQLAKEVAGATLTVSQAFTVLTNEAVKFAGDADKASGATDTLSKALVNLSSGLSTVGSFIREHETAFSVLTTTLASAAVAAGIYATGAAVLSLTGALVAMGTAVMAHPVLLVIGGIAAGVMALDQVNKGYAKTVRGMGEEVTRLSERINAAEKVLAGTKGGSELTRQMEERVAAMKRVRAELQGQLALSSVKGLDTTAEDARLARHTKAVKDQARAEEDLAKLRLKLSGVPDGYLKDMNEIIRLNQAGVLTGKAYTDALKTQQDALLKKTGVTKTAAKDTANAYATEQDAAKHWADAMQDGGKMLADVEAKSLGLNAAQTRLKDLMADPLWAQMPEVWRDMATAKLTEASAAIEARTAHEAYTRAITEQNAGWQRNVETLQQRIDALDDEARAASLAKSQNIGLAQAVELVGIARLREQQYAAEAAGNYAMVDALQREIDKRRELARMVGEKEARETTEKTAKEAAKEAADAWQKTADSIYEGLTDSLYRAFESGKGFFNALWSSIKNAFKTTVLKLAVQGIMTGIGLGTASSAVNAATGSAAGSLLGSAGGSLLGGFGASMAGITATLGQFSTAALASTQSLLGLTGTAAQASNAAILGAANQTGASTLASSAGSAIPYVAAALAVAAGLGLFRSTKTVATGLMGTVGESNDVSGYNLRRKSGYLFGGPDYSVQATTLDAATAQSVDASLAMIRSSSRAYAAALGLGTQALSGFTMQLGSDIINRDTGQVGIEFKDLTPEQIAAKIQAELTRVGDAYAQRLIGTFTEVTTSFERQVNVWVGEFDYGRWEARTEVDTTTTSVYTPSEFAREGETASQTLTRLATSLATVNGLWHAMGTTLLASNLAAGDAASRLADAAGGLDALKASMNGYYEAMYSEEEKRANTTRLYTEALQAVNLAVPATIEAYRAQVAHHEAIAATEPGAAAALATLYAMAPAFASVNQAAQDAGAAVLDMSEAAREMERALGSVDDEIRRLRGEIADDSPAGQAWVTAQFATLTAQARAGDVTAMQQLPQLSQALEDIASRQAASATDLARIRARLAASLEDTYRTVGGPAPGAVYASVTGSSSGGDPASTAAGAAAQAPNSTARLEALVEKLTDEVTALRQKAAETATHTGRTVSLIQQVMPDGDAIATRVAA